MYHYDRYLLPIALILSIFAGHALARFTGARGPLLRSRRLIAVLAVGISIAYAASVNVLLASDTRYDAEEWIRGHIAPGSRVLAVGHQSYLPRLPGLDVLYNTEPDLQALAELEPDYVLLTSIFEDWRFRNDPEALAFLRDIRAGRTPFALVYSQQSRPRLNLLSLDGVRTNLDKINPRIRIYRHRRSAGTPSTP
jgi:hypothetical protein